MPVVTITQSTTVLGYTNVGNRTITVDDAIVAAPSIAVAKTGTLTTRTSDTAGTLTMASGHGITNGAKLDIYWSGGSCYGATVGTVASLSVPFTLASGTVLPVADTTITAMVPSLETFVIAATSGIQVVSCSCDAPATFVFRDSAAATALAKVTGATSGYEWDVSTNSTVPFAGNGSLATVYVSHGDSGTARVPAAIALIN